MSDVSFPTTGTLKTTEQGFIVQFAGIETWEHGTPVGQHLHAAAHDIKERYGTGVRVRVQLTADYTGACTGYELMEVIEGGR